jgi:hypothetical protein
VDFLEVIEGKEGNRVEIVVTEKGFAGFRGADLP